MSADRLLGRVGAGLVGLALLLPPSDPPWPSFWRECVAALGLLLWMADGLARLRDARRPLRVEPFGTTSIALLLAIAALMQGLAGLAPYRADVLLVAASLVGFALSQSITASLSDDDRAHRIDDLAAAMLAAAVLSVPLAVAQWLGFLTSELGVHVTAGRPVAHMEQANLLCSLLLQGLFATWRLHARGRIGRRAAAALVIVLLVGASLTQSRVAWLVVVGVGSAWMLRRRALEARGLVGRGVVLAVAAGVALGAVLVPWLDARWGLAGVDLAERISGGRRPELWRLSIHAIEQHPWSGWGVQGNAAAQFALADHHRLLYQVFSSAHDLPLDLALWFGVPLALVAVAALGLTLWRGVAQAHDDATFATAAAALALALHALVELPLHYVYFLWPLGAWLGAAGHRRSAGRAIRLTVGRLISPTAVLLVGGGMLALLVHDYGPLTDARPTTNDDVRIHHFALEAPLPVPDAQLLDSLRELQLAAKVNPDAASAGAPLDAVRRSMRRFPHAAVQEHAARVLAVNGRPEEALYILQRSCRFQSPDQCDESHRAWDAWRALGQALPEWPGDDGWRERLGARTAAARAPRASASSAVRPAPASPSSPTAGLPTSPPSR
jgi:O-antigen ligase